MAGPEVRHYYDCPYCASRVFTRVNLAGGAGQSYGDTCSICRQPVMIHVALDRGRVTGLVAEPEP